MTDSLLLGQLHRESINKLIKIEKRKKILEKIYRNSYNKAISYLTFKYLKQ